MNKKEHDDTSKSVKGFAVQYKNMINLVSVHVAGTAIPIFVQGYLPSIHVSHIEYYFIWFSKRSTDITLYNCLVSIMVLKMGWGCFRNEREPKDIIDEV